MAEKKDKPVVPTLRGETWRLADNRDVTFLKLLEVVPKVGRLYQVLNELGLLEAVFERQFVRRINPPVSEDVERMGPGDRRDAGRRGNDGY